MFSLVVAIPEVSRPRFVEFYDEKESKLPRYGRFYSLSLFRTRIC